MTEKNLIHPNERKYFIPVMIASIILYLSLILSVTGILLLLLFGLLSFFSSGLMLANIRVNGVKLSKSQFPMVFEKVEALCAKMNIIKVPDVYVLRSDGVFNAFATKFFERDMVILYSEVFDLIERNAEDELVFIIAHELAHIKRRHVAKQLLVMPAMWIPFLSGAYSQGCEYTCDRIGAYYLENEKAARNSLTILAIGKTLYKNVDHADYIDQAGKERGLFVWLVQRLSTHPPLHKRIQEVQLIKTYECTQPLKSKRWILSVLLIIPILAGVGFGLSKVLPEANLFQPAESQLIDAVVENNKDKINSLIDTGVELNQEDSYGWTPLHWAIEDNNASVVEILINAGANINHLDSNDVSPLIRAAYMGNTEIIRMLLNNGSNIDHQDFYGETALFNAVNYEQKEAVKLLLDNGANRDLKNTEGYTALMYAIQLGDRDIIALLRERQK